MMMVAPTDRQQPWWVQQAETLILFLWVFLYLGGTKSSTPPPALSLSLNPQDTPSSKFKAVAAALIRNKNRIKTPGKPPDISTAFKTGAALEDDNEENNKQQNTNTRFLSATIALCIFSYFKKDCLKSKSYNENGTSVKAGESSLRTKKRKNRSTNINEEPHLARLRAFLLTNLKPQ